MPDLPKMPTAQDVLQRLARSPEGVQFSKSMYGFYADVIQPMIDSGQIIERPRKSEQGAHWSFVTLFLGTVDDETLLRGAIADVGSVLADWLERGVVITVSLKSNQPPAMGSYRQVIDARKAKGGAA